MQGGLLVCRLGKCYSGIADMLAKGKVSHRIGVAMYWVAALSTILNDCPNSTLSTDEYVRRRPAASHLLRVALQGACNLVQTMLRQRI